MKRLIIVLCVAILFGVLGRYSPPKPKTTNFISTNKVKVDLYISQFIREYYEGTSHEKA